MASGFLYLASSAALYYGRFISAWLLGAAAYAINGIAHAAFGQWYDLFGDIFGVAYLASLCAWALGGGRLALLAASLSALSSIMYDWSGSVAGLGGGPSALAFLMAAPFALAYTAGGAARNFTHVGAVVSTGVFVILLYIYIYIFSRSAAPPLGAIGLGVLVLSAICALASTRPRVAAAALLIALGVYLASGLVMPNPILRSIAVAAVFLSFATGRTRLLVGVLASLFVLAAASMWGPQLVPFNATYFLPLSFGANGVLLAQSQQGPIAVKSAAISFSDSAASIKTVLAFNIDRERIERTYLLPVSIDGTSIRDVFFAPPHLVYVTISAGEDLAQSVYAAIYLNRIFGVYNGAVGTINVELVVYPYMLVLATLVFLSISVWIAAYMFKKPIRLFFVLFLLFLFAHTALGYPIKSANCNDCHGGSGCLSCHTSTYLTSTAHGVLSNAVLYRSPPPSSPNYCACHFGVSSTTGGGGMVGGPGMSPSCACHVVIHINLTNHGFQFPSEVVVENYLPTAQSPYVSPSLYIKQAKLWYNCTRAPANCPPNLHQLVTSLYSAGYTQNVVVVALWDWYRGDVILPLPGGVGPSAVAGVYGEAADSSWTSCFNCHFVYVSPWAVGATINATKQTNPGASFIQHPDLCQPCHGVPKNATDVSRTIWAHNIYGYSANGADAIWSNCGVCHSAIASVVSSSVHSSIGCECHAVVHMGYSYNGMWLAGLYTFEGSGVGVAPSSLVRAVRVYTPYNVTAGVSQLVSFILAKTPGENIEVGLWDAYLNDYVSTLPLGPGPEAVWATCFSCHFMSIDPSKFSDPHGIQATSIGVVELPAAPPTSTTLSMSGWRGGTVGAAVVFLIVALGVYILFRRDSN
ncbi:MAG: hypothetical protein QXP98_07720 [Thermoproteus sp.]